jgi:hypothetical protein
VQTVDMQVRRLAQLVGKLDAQPVAGLQVQRRPGHDAVVAQDRGLAAGERHRLGGDVETDLKEATGAAQRGRLDEIGARHRREPGAGGRGQTRTADDGRGQS